MTYEQEIQAIESRLMLNWSERVSYSAQWKRWIADENGEPVWFTFSEVPYWLFNGEEPLSSAPQSPWMRLTIQDIDTRVNGIGGSNYRYRHDGLITVQVFVPAEQGSALASGLAEKVGAVFAPARFDGIRTYEAEVRRVGNTDDGLYQVNCLIGFHRYTVKQEVTP